MLVRHFLHLRDIARLLLGQKDATFFHFLPKTCLIVSEYLTEHPRLEVSLLVILCRAYTHISRSITVAADILLSVITSVCAVSHSAAAGVETIYDCLAKGRARPRLGYRCLAHNLGELYVAQSNLNHISESLVPP